MPSKYTSSKRKKNVKKGLSTAKRAVKKKRGGKLKWFLILLIIAAAFAFYLHDQGKITLPAWIAGEPPEPIPEGSAQVHFIDVGQGDCELIIADDGTTVLIDSGEYDYASTVLGYLEDHGITRLDYIVVSHPHTDHMGGMATIIRDIPEVGTFIMPRVADDFIPTTTAYEKMLEALEKKGCEVRMARTEEIDIGSGKLKLITADYSGDNMNNYSVVVKYSLNDTAFLFSGDLEADMEKQLLNAGHDLTADVYKLAHHGSTTSNSALWLTAICPDYCVCECGANNSYGHPHREIVTAVRDYTDILLRTDINGNIVFTTDGANITYKCSK